MTGDLTYFRRNAVNYYGVFCEGFDKGNPYNDILTDVRKKYYESGLKPQKNKFILKNDDGIYRYNYTLNEDMVLKWKVFNEAHIVERVIVSKEDNYRVEIRDRSGKILKKCIYFGLYHNWVKTKYFVEGKEKPEVELVYWDEKGVAVILKYTADGDDRYPDVLYPCTVVNDKELQKKITDKLGVPEVYSLCSNGLVYFAEKSISRQWNRYCANPSLLDPEGEKTASRVSDKTAEFKPVKNPDEEEKPAHKKRIDLTQTYDVIVPNVVQSDSVIINKNKNSDDGDDTVPFIPSRSFGLNISSLNLDLGNKNEAQNEAVKPKLHSDSLLDYSESFMPEKSENKEDSPVDNTNDDKKHKKSEERKNIDVFDYLSEDEPEEDEDSDLVENDPDGERIMMELDPDEEDDDNRVLDSSDAVENEPPQIFDNQNIRSYDYKKVRGGNDGIKQDSFEENDDSSDDDSEESITDNSKRNAFDDENKKISAYNGDDTLKSIEPDGGYPSGNTADKIIRISDDEVYYYYGELNENGKRDGKGRTAMQNGSTAYDGGYSNDLRNGFGVYYYRNGKICYVGDWKDNHRNGVGISFNHKDRSMYVGGWENDCPIGMGAKFDESGNLTFAGRYENGTREGVGMVYNPTDGGVFVSRWENDRLSDRGTVFDAMGNLVYNGSWKKGTRNGMGTQYDKKGLVVYSGEWKNGKYNGEGMLNLSNGYKIVGEFVMGKVDGYAVVTTKKGKKLYEGHWKNNRYNGEGKLYNLRNGSWCQGTFSNGNPVGILAGYSSEGELLYEGEWSNGKYHGSGVCYEDGEKVYEGEWQDGIRSGNGSEYKDETCVYIGGFKNNMRNGFGTSYSSDGQIEYSGLWTDNCYDGIGILYVSGQPRFVGSFSMGSLNGRVNEILRDTVVKECIYKDGECVYMREYTDDGLTLKYEGHVKNGSYEGMGCGFSAYGEKYFEGIFKKNEPFKSMKVRLKKLDDLTYSDEVSRSEYHRFIKGPDYVIEQDFGGGAYSGLLVNGRPEGKGTIIYIDHGYTGAFSDGVACGVGVIYEWDGSEIKGTFTKQASDNTKEITFANGVTYHLRNS